MTTTKHASADDDFAYGPDFETETVGWDAAAAARRNAAALDAIAEALREYDKARRSIHVPLSPWQIISEVVASTGREVAS